MAWTGTSWDPSSALFLGVPGPAADAVCAQAGNGELALLWVFLSPFAPVFPQGPLRPFHDWKQNSFPMGDPCPRDPKGCGSSRMWTSAPTVGNSASVSWIRGSAVGVKTHCALCPVS